MMESWWFPGYASVVVFGAFFVRSLTGFGSALISIPLLALVFDLKFIVPAEAILEVAISLLLFRQIYQDIDLRTVLPMMMGVALGSLLGVYVLTNVPSTLLKQALGGLILLYAGYLVMRKSAAVQVRTPAVGWALAAGGMGGIIGGTVGTSGPPYVIYLSYRLPAKKVLRATLIALFAFDGLWRIGLFASQGLMTGEVLRLALLLLPALAVGTVLGRRTHLGISQSHFTQLVAGILGLAGLLLCFG